MAYLIINPGRTDGTVCFGKSFQVISAGQKITSDVSPDSWTRGIKVVKQNDPPQVSGKKPYGKAGVPSSPPAEGTSFGGGA